ncbi:Hsp70 family protein [Allofournierella sp.]|mgnify:FL=1|uniref:Hsp70 family protein n=1 Tax=Allofournierella sp. TaxID=1940256 RepID=UPI003AB4F8C3
MLIGIDLGTTNSLAAYFDGEKPVLIPNRLGEALTPSVVSVDKDGTVLVGRAAKERAMLDPFCSAAVFKRAMGTDKEFELSGKKFKAVELSSLVLRSLKEDAEAFLGQPVDEAIISVPAYFNDLQRKATRQAGEMAGFRVDRIINEPTAAALAYGMGQKQSGRFLVFDLGGGTFDVSILELDAPVMEVHAIAGDNFLGGENFTAVLMELFLERTGLALEQLTYGELSHLAASAELAKVAFTTGAVVSMACTVDGTEQRVDVTIADFDAACEPLFEKLRKPIERSLRDAGLMVDDLDQIVLVGGATKASLVRRFVAKLFGRQPAAGVDPDLAVALGAAMQCGMKQRNQAIKEIILTDVCPFTLGTSVVRSNGLFEESGFYCPIIERNTVIPVSRTETFYTANDNQKQIRVDILQGESRLARNNLYLGEVVVPVPQGPRGKESVRVTYTYDINALLQVEVEVTSTGVKKQIILQSGQNAMSDEEAAARMAELAALKLSPRDQEENKLAMMRAERMYEESTGAVRRKVDGLIAAFDTALASQDPLEAERGRKALLEALDQLEEGAQ